MFDVILCQAVTNDLTEHIDIKRSTKIAIQRTNILHDCVMHPYESMVGVISALGNSHDLTGVIDS